MVAAVCSIPLRYRQSDGPSFRQCVVDTGYFDKPEELSVAATAGFLQQHPEFIDPWFNFSEDKRTSSGWFVLDEDDCAVAGQVHGPRIVFSDRTQTCAEFIVREIGGLR